MEARDLNCQDCGEKEDSVQETEKDRCERGRDKEGKGGRRPFHGGQKVFGEEARGCVGQIQMMASYQSPQRSN